jgi:hypothetical protein
VLEATSVLSSAVSWQPVTNTVEVTGNMLSVTVEPGTPTRFFRLRRPAE